MCNQINHSTSKGLTAALLTNFRKQHGTPTPEEVAELCYDLMGRACNARKDAVNEYFADLNAKPLERAAELLDYFTNVS